MQGRDDRRQKLMRLLDDLLAKGCRPSEIEMDGLRVIIGSYKTEEPSTTTSSSQQDRSEPSGRPLGYRERARLDLAKRLGGEA